MRQILLIPHIQIQNANALSSPFTIGFPAMTAWLGAVHAMQRKLNESGYADIKFKSTGIVCHEMNLQTYKGGYDNYIIGMANPLNKDGSRPSFIAEGRCHLEVSLVIEYFGLSNDGEFPEVLKKILSSACKIAGGDILKFEDIEFFNINSDDDFRRLVRKLMPGYVIVERRELMIKLMEEGFDAIDALLEHVKVMHCCEENEEGKIEWVSKRKSAGWIVPLATGFHGISPLGKAKNQRDSDKPHRFAESVVTLGEFIMPYRCNNVDEMLWHTSVDSDKNLYLCQQNSKMD